MKALSLWQPWATLVAIGAKGWETRSWFMKHRGPLAIHAAKKCDDENMSYCLEEPFRSVLAAAGYDKIGEFPLGCVLCTVDVARCLDTLDARRQGLISEQERAFGDYSAQRYCSELVNLKRLEEPIPARGGQLIWNWNELAAVGPITAFEHNAAKYPQQMLDFEDLCPACNSRNVCTGTGIDFPVGCFGCEDCGNKWPINVGN